MTNAKAFVITYSQHYSTSCHCGMNYVTKENLYFAFTKIQNQTTNLETIIFIECIHF